MKFNYSQQDVSDFCKRTGRTYKDFWDLCSYIAYNCEFEEHNMHVIQVYSMDDSLGEDTIWYVFIWKKNVYDDRITGEVSCGRN